MRDIDRVQQFPNAVRDPRGRLRVGAAVGVKDRDRVKALIKAEVDVIVVDTAHGHSKNVLEMAAWVKENFNIDVIAGNIATAHAAEDLIAAGVDAVKVGKGPRRFAPPGDFGRGCAADFRDYGCAAAADKHDVPVIADGGCG